MKEEDSTNWDEKQRVSGERPTSSLEAQEKDQEVDQQLLEALVWEQEPMV